MNPPSTSHTIRSPRRRRWLQFTLRTLVVLMTLVAVGCTILGWSLRRRLEQRRAVRHIESLGAIVHYRAPGTYWQQTAWLERWLGEELLQDVTGVWLDGCPEVDDSTLVHVAGLTDLEELCLANTHVTDAGLVHLRNLPRLRRLNVTNTQVTDDGLRQLQIARPAINADP